MNRELMQRALEAVEKTYFPSRLADELRAELAKPAPIECGTLEIRLNIPFNTWDFSKLEEGGNYRLFAVRCDDE